MKLSIGTKELSIAGYKDVVELNVRNGDSGEHIIIYLNRIEAAAIESAIKEARKLT